MADKKAQKPVRKQTTAPAEVIEVPPVVAAKPDPEKEQLVKALLEKAAENEALKIIARSSGGERIVLKNLGHCDLVIPVEGAPPVYLRVSGAMSTGSVPLHVYERLRRETKWFDDGLISVLGETTATNPNAIDDPDVWLDSVDEANVEAAVCTITAEGALNRLWFALMARRDKPTGKDLLIKQSIAARYEALFDIELGEE
jgi:hypothetical protein